MKSVLIASILLVLCSLGTFAQDKLEDLKSVNELQKQFTSDAGKVRLIALLSPT